MDTPNLTWIIFLNIKFQQFLQYCWLTLHSSKMLLSIPMVLSYIHPIEKMYIVNHFLYDFSNLFACIYLDIIFNIWYEFPDFELVDDFVKIKFRNNRRLLFVRFLLSISVFPLNRSKSRLPLMLRYLTVCSAKRMLFM